jgi:hypothetical protein
MRKRLFVEFRVLNTAKLQMVKRWYPIRSDPDHLFFSDGARRGLRTRFKHVQEPSMLDARDASFWRRRIQTRLEEQVVIERQKREVASKTDRTIDSAAGEFLSDVSETRQ